MEIRISRKGLLRLLVVLGLPLGLVGLYLLGRQVTPYTAAGAPVLLSPSVRASLAYRRQAGAWTERLSALDADLAGLHGNNGQDLYEQTRQAEALLAAALRVAQEIEVRQAPSALAGLRALLVEAAHRYYEAAQAIARWVGAPSPENDQAVQTALASGRLALDALRANRWLQAPAPGPLSAPAEEAPTP